MRLPRLRTEAFPSAMSEPARPLVAVYDTKPYDREYLGRAQGVGGIEMRFNEFRLEPATAYSAGGALAVCVFVNDNVQHAVLEHLARLGVRHVALRCAGYNNVDLPAAKRLGLTVTRVPSYSPHAVAEHTIALILTLNRKTHRAFVRVRELNFSLSGLVGFDLHGKTAGLIATGKTGRIVGDILHGFGMKVLAFDPYPNAEWAERTEAAYVDLATLARESDIVSLHAPLTRETDRIVGADFLAQMKNDAMLVNVSRGRLVHTTALIATLKSGRLGGVALDVYEEEEGVFFEDLSEQVLEDDELARLLTFPNVLITAHQAFLTREALKEIARVTVENLRLLAAGQPFLEGTAL